MLKSLKRNWRRLRNGKPGRRFRDSYDARQKERSGPLSFARIVIIVIAVALILGGLAIGWLPGPGGFIGIFGLALLAQEFRPLARVMDWVEVMIRALWTWFKRLPAVAKVCIILMCAAAGAAAVYLVYRISWSA